MPKAQRIPLSVVDKVKATLRAAPPKNEVIQTKALEILAPDIIKQKEKGYTMKEIKATLESAGLVVHMSKLARIFRGDDKACAAGNKNKKGTAENPATTENADTAKPASDDGNQSEAGQQADTPPPHISDGSHGNNGQPFNNGMAEIISHPQGQIPNPHNNGHGSWNKHHG